MIDHAERWENLTRYTAKFQDKYLCTLLTYLTFDKNDETEITHFIDYLMRENLIDSCRELMTVINDNVRHRMKTNSTIIQLPFIAVKASFLQHEIETRNQVQVKTSDEDQVKTSDRLKTEIGRLLSQTDLTTSLTALQQHLKSEDRTTIASIQAIIQTRTLTPSTIPQGFLSRAVSKIKTIKDSIVRDLETTKLYDNILALDPNELNATEKLISYFNSYCNPVVLHSVPKKVEDTATKFHQIL